MENMRQEAAWQTLRQIKAVDAYRIEGGQRYEELISTIKHDVARTIYHLRIVQQQETSTPVSRAADTGGTGKKQPARVGGRKIGRNEPCPCGSGKKYKHCCGR
jgi:preprotein translocase subunit SecA